MADWPWTFPEWGEPNPKGWLGDLRLKIELSGVGHLWSERFFSCCHFWNRYLMIDIDGDEDKGDEKLLGDKKNETGSAILERIWAFRCCLLDEKAYLWSEKRLIINIMKKKSNLYSWLIKLNAAPMDEMSVEGSEHHSKRTSSKTIFAPSRCCKKPTRRGRSERACSKKTNPLPNEI